MDMHHSHGNEASMTQDPSCSPPPQHATPSSPNSSRQDEVRSYPCAAANSSVGPSVEAVATTWDNAGDGDNGPRTSEKPAFFYRDVRWTADGTSVIASTSDNRISTFVLPEDLLEPRHGPRLLKSQGELQLPEPFYALAPSPYFTLSEPLSQTALISSKDHPIQLHSLFPKKESEAPSVNSSQICSYKLIRKETEEYITAESLLWSWPGTHFIVGSCNRLDYFDVSRTGSDGPTLTIPTIPSKRHRLKGGGVGMKGMVSALSTQGQAVSETPLIAAGTWTRWLGLYDLARSNKAAANWSIKGVADGIFEVPDEGNGIVQTLWSPCGRYLAINERKASGILVYDVRGTGQPLSVLVGRDADTQQRLSCDVFPGSQTSTAGGFELWAGSTDGQVLVWDGLGREAGCLENSWSFQAHSSPVGGTMLHSSGSVVASCSGAWTEASDDAVDAETGSLDSDGQPSLGSTRITNESCVRVWAIGMDPGDTSVTAIS